MKRPTVDLVNDLEKANLPIIEADVHRCTQVFYNLVMNALKFTMNGEVRITGRWSMETGEVEIHVTDTGIGISKAHLERVFEPFEQEDDSEARTFEGIGLGLSISREVVQRHGGRIRVTSEVTKGSTFTVVLPVVAKEVKFKNTAEQLLQPPPARVEKLSRLPNHEDEGHQAHNGLQRKKTGAKLPEAVHEVEAKKELTAQERMQLEPRHAPAPAAAPPAALPPALTWKKQEEALPPVAQIAAVSVASQVALLPAHSQQALVPLRLAPESGKALQSAMRARWEELHREMEELRAGLRDREREARKGRAELAACKAKLEATEQDADEVWQRLMEAERQLADSRRSQERAADQQACAKYGLAL